jgi:NAD(P)-dependent dehydrogenase (short-subunit alcohol dehydrogenase family)
LSFAGRVAVVTGAGRGLGRAYAIALAAKGASVIVNDLGGALDGSLLDDAGDPAGAVAEEIRKSGGKVTANRGDVSQPKQAHELIDSAVAKYGRVDIVVSNAGIVRRKPFGMTTLDDFKDHIAVHQIGTFNICRAAWPVMCRQSYGRIVGVISSALFGVDNVAAYASAKGGILGLAKTMAIEGAEYGIKTNLIAPVAYTRMTASGRFGKSARTVASNAMSPDRVAVTVAVLAHEDCPSSAEMYLASGTRVARVFFGETSGFTHEDLSAELLLANWDSVLSTESFTLPMPRPEGATSAWTAGTEGPSLPAHAARRS